MINKQYLLIFFMLLTQVGLIAQNEDPIFNDFPWLNLLIDQNNCEFTNVDVYIDNAGTQFVYVTIGDTQRLFYGDGEFACLTASNINCLEFCGIGQNNLVDSWVCPSDGGMFTDPPNDNIFGQTVPNIVNTSFDELKIYPTVANETIQVFFSEKADIRLLSLSGQILQVVPHAEGNSTLKVADLTEGYYMVQVLSEKNMETFKVMVTH